MTVFEKYGWIWLQRRGHYGPLGAKNWLLCTTFSNNNVDLNIKFHQNRNLLCEARYADGQDLLICLQFNCSVQRAHLNQYKLQLRCGRRRQTLSRSIILNDSGGYLQFSCQSQHVMIYLLSEKHAACGPNNAANKPPSKRFQLCKINWIWLN
jgi:hypothetical protein